MCPNGRLGAPRTSSLGTGTCQLWIQKDEVGMKSSLRTNKATRSFNRFEPFPRVDQEGGYDHLDDV